MMTQEEGTYFFMACQDFEYCTLVRAWFLMSDNMGKQMLFVVVSLAMLREILDKSALQV